MKSSIAILVTFLICLVLVTVYYFVGKTQMNKTIVTLDQEIEAYDNELAEIRKNEQEIKRLTKQLPTWLKQSRLFKNSIPAKVDDHVFFSALAKELESNPGVELQSLESVFGGAWLGEVKEDEANRLSEMGIDPDVAAGIRVVFYSINLMGDFDDVLNVFENLKKSQRLYTIDLIAGPAMGGSGTISVNSQEQATPLQFSGRLYYNLPEPALSTEGLEGMFFDALTMHVHRRIIERGESAITGESSVKPATAPEDPVDAAADNEPVDEVDVDTESETDAEPEVETGPDWVESEDLEDQIALAVAGTSGSTMKEGHSDG